MAKAILVIDMPKSCRGHQFYKPMSNADKIRNMTDEELAELFTKLAWNGEVQTTPLKYLDWLQSEVKGSE